MKMRLWCLMIVLLAGLCFAQDIPYKTGQWDGDKLGNHRAVIRVEGRAKAAETNPRAKPGAPAAADAVWAHIPWRRRDASPEKKGIIVMDGRTGARVKNVFPADINREYGDIVFQPVSGPGDYYVYDLPYKLAGSRNYPTAVYLAPEKTAEPEWLSRNGVRYEAAAPAPTNVPAGALHHPAPIAGKFPQARVIEFQSIDAFNSFDPMEIIATAGETKRLMAGFPDAPYLLFPEDRKFSIRMTDDLPLRWIRSGPRKVFSGEAGRGEYYAFQIGVYAVRADLADVAVVFGELKNVAGAGTIPSSAFHCLNTGGVDWNGEPLKKIVSVAKGKIQALWCGVQVPLSAAPGDYDGLVRVRPRNLPEGEIALRLRITNEVLPDAGDGDPFRMSKIRWLDSTLASDDELVAPFTPLIIEGDTVSCLGRSVTLGKSGLPVQIRSFFAPDVTRIVQAGRDLLAAPFELIIEDGAGSRLDWKDGAIHYVKKAPGAVGWETSRRGGPATAEIKARMEMDGYLEFQVRLSVASALEVKDIRLEIPLVEDAAKYMMGMGVKGGRRPAEFQWSWDQKKIRTPFGSATSMRACRSA